MPYNTTPYSYDPTYGGIPNLPPTLTDTTAQVGTDIQRQMIQNLPNYLAMLGGDVGNIQANLAGQLSPDVIALLQQQGAERGIATGAPGSPNSNAAYLRALGLTSQQLQQLGNQQLTAAMQRTPIQQTQTGSQTTDLAALRALYAAAPVPAYAAGANWNAMNQGLGMGQGAVGGRYDPTNLAGTYASNAAYERALDQQLAQIYGRTSLASPRGQETFPRAGAPAVGRTNDPYAEWDMYGGIDPYYITGPGADQPVFSDTTPSWSNPLWPTGAAQPYGPSTGIGDPGNPYWQESGSGYINPQTQDLTFFDPRMGEPAYTNAMYDVFYGGAVPEGSQYYLPADTMTPDPLSYYMDWGGE